MKKFIVKKLNFFFILLFVSILANGIFIRAANSVCDGTYYVDDQWCVYCSDLTGDPTDDTEACFNAWHQSQCTDDCNCIGECYDCPDQQRSCQIQDEGYITCNNNQDYPIFSCVTKEYGADSGCAENCCYYIKVEQGECPENGNGGDEHTSCILTDLNYPATVGIGEDFNVTYNFWGTGPNDYPYEVRERSIEDGGSECIYGEDHLEGVWHSDTAVMTCPNTPGEYLIWVTCGASEYADITDCGKQDDFKVGYVTCEGPVSIGHIRIQGPGGLIKLNIISADDAIAAGRGTVKIAMTAGDINSAADLVETDHPDASPVRIYTGLGGSNGIKAWRELKE